MPNNVINESEYSKKVAFYFCFFGGWLGLHYFYVGRVGRGLLALCTLNFMTLGWFIDTVVIMRGKFKDDKGKYLSAGNILS